MATELDKLLEETVQTGPHPPVHLMVMNGPEDGRIFPLTKDSTTIGRLDSNDVALCLDPVVSRSHARILREGDRFFVVDLNSKFGSEVNGVRIDGGGRKELSQDCMIRIGETMLRFRLTDPATM
jgi:pSer/pThr/pTyr-binding forkhead associated (FHA) protein